MAYSASTGQVSGTVASNAVVKDYTATITANDGVNPDVTATFTVTVTAASVSTPANSPPSIANPGSKSYAQGEAITAFAITVTDADAGDTVTVAVSGLPDGLAYSASTGQVSGTVDSNAVVKDYTATITANDGVNDAVTATFTVTVALAAITQTLNREVVLNSAPVITNPGNKFYTQGEAITAFAITVTDADAGDTVTVSVSGLPSGLAYSASTGQVSGTVDSSADAKDYTVTITADDGVNDAVTETFTVTVAARIVVIPPSDGRQGQPLVLNSAPVITNPGDKRYTQGDAITAFAITVTDDDAGDTVTVTVSGLPSGLSYSASAGEVSGTVDSSADAQDYTATITANDGVNDAVTETFTVTVALAAGSQSLNRLVTLNSAPVITNPGDKRYTRGNAITAFAIIVTDDDAGDTVTVSVSGLPDGLSYSASAGEVSGAVDASAVAKGYTATITARDGVNDAVTETFTVTVAAGSVVTPPVDGRQGPPRLETPANSPPVIVNPGDKVYTLGDVIHPFAITVTDAEDVPSVSVAGLPPGLLYSRITGRVSGTVSTIAVPKDYYATITADDGVNDPVTATFRVRALSRDDDDDDDDDDRRVVSVEDTEPTAEPAPTEAPTIRPPVWHTNPDDAGGAGGGTGTDAGGGAGSGSGGWLTPTPTPTPAAGSGLATPEPTVGVARAAALAAVVDAPRPTPRAMRDAPPATAPALPRVLPPSEPHGMDDGVIQLALKWSWWLLLLLALLAVLVAVVYFSSRENRYYLD